MSRRSRAACTGSHRSHCSNTLKSNTLKSDALDLSSRSACSALCGLQARIRLGHCGVLWPCLVVGERPSRCVPRKPGVDQTAEHTHLKRTNTHTSKQAAPSPASAPGLDCRCAGDTAGAPNASAPPRTPRASCAKSYIRSQCTDGSGLWPAERPSVTRPRRNQVLRRRMAFCTEASLPAGAAGAAAATAHAHAPAGVSPLR